MYIPADGYTGHKLQLTHLSRSAIIPGSLQEILPRLQPTHPEGCDSLSEKVGMALQLLRFNTRTPRDAICEGYFVVSNHGVSTHAPRGGVRYLRSALNANPPKLQLTHPEGCDLSTPLRGFSFTLQSSHPGMRWHFILQYAHHTELMTLCIT